MSKVKKGKSAKDSGYLERIKNAIKNDRSHPRNLGVRMQAHHVISGEGMIRSGKGSTVVGFGYNINFLPNLAFIPCTLQGSCYLGVQPHRGNHSAASVADQDDYDDSDHVDYHDKVASQLVEVIDRHLEQCTGDDDEIAEKGIEVLNKLSKAILRGIQFNPTEYPLTSIARHFGKGGAGCGGVDSVTDHSAGRKCPVGRNHLFDSTGGGRASHGEEGQVSEDIHFELRKPFRLKFEGEII